MRDAIYVLKSPHAGVCVKQVKKDFVITDETGNPLTGVKPQTRVIELDTERIIGLNNTELSPTGRFFITADTSYPYHIILDIMDITILQYAGLRDKT